MTLEEILLVVLLLLMGYLFISEKLPIDLTAFLGLLFLLFGGYIEPKTAFSGFSSPTVITIFSVFFLSAALRETGVADRFAGLLQKYAGRSEPLLIAAVMLVAALFSSFMPNVAATSLLLPCVVVLGHRTETPPSKLLIPMAFGAILGGMCTLIGTPSNMLASGALSDAGLKGLGFFTVMPLGLAVLLVGVLFMAVLGRHLLPRIEASKRFAGAADLPGVYGLTDSLSSVKISPESVLCGKSVRDAELGVKLGLQVVAIVRKGSTILPVSPIEVLHEGDTLFVTGEPQRLKKIVEEKIVSFQGKTNVGLESLDVGIVEVVLSPRSKLVGATLRELRFRERYDFQVLAIWRKGEPRRTGIGDFRLRFGDALLLQGARKKFSILSKDPDFVVLTESPKSGTRRGKAPFVLFAVAVMVFLPTFGIQSVEAAAFLAACMVVLCGAITMEEAYREIEWKILFFVAALLPLGAALQNTHLSGALSDELALLGQGYGPSAAFIGFALVTSALSQLLDGSLAVIVLAPLAIRAAGTLGVNPEALIMTVALSASIAFMTPFSSKAALLVMGAGGYRTKDYFLVGTLLSLLTLVVVLVGIGFLYGM